VNHSEISRQLAELIAENQRGSTALFETEKALAEAEHSLDLQESKSFLKAQGTVADRQALSRLESADIRLQRDLRKAEHNRVRVKIKGIEVAIMALATQVKLTQSEARL